ncbi:hypothetical protein MAR_026303 [Mya arenaria]|uniref:Uncharacterized protein n=1 Tax=Mya arenaria TaxID=6604 RepID=A0ABY7EQ91_MYAAR|nr:hypothetical protein MAR_026303 [Mya arenaria]
MLKTSEKSNQEKDGVSVYLLDNDKRINDVKIIEDHEDAVVAHEKLKYHESAQKDIHDEGQEYDIDEIEQDNNDGLGDIDEIGDINGDEEEDEYQFPPLTRLDPEYVGQEVYLELVDGVRFRRITRAMKPPVFGFLSDEECDYIIEAAKDNGLEMSALFGEDVEKQFDADLPLEKVTRVSQQTWLDGTHIGGEFWDRLQTSYKEGGHYHAHIDTVEYNDKPCCIQTGCGEKELTPEWKECCRLCRLVISAKQTCARIMGAVIFGRGRNGSQTTGYHQYHSKIDLSDHCFILGPRNKFCLY